MFRVRVMVATLTSELVNINNHIHVVSSWCIPVQSSDRPGKDLLEIALLDEVWKLWSKNLRHVLCP